MCILWTIMRQEKAYKSEEVSMSNPFILDHIGWAVSSYSCEIFLLFVIYKESWDIFKSWRKWWVKWSMIKSRKSIKNSLCTFERCFCIWEKEKRKKRFKIRFLFWKKMFLEKFEISFRRNFLGPHYTKNFHQSRKILIISCRLWWSFHFSWSTQFGWSSVKASSWSRQFSSQCVVNNSTKPWNIIVSHMSLRRQSGWGRNEIQEARDRVRRFLKSLWNR